MQSVPNQEPRVIPEKNLVIDPRKEAAIINKIIDHLDSGGLSNIPQNDLMQLSKPTREVLLDGLGSIISGDYNRIISNFSDDDYEGKVLSPEEFFTDEVISPEINQTIYPVWRKDLYRVCNPENKIYEVIVTGSIGSGKSLFSTLALIYDVYCLLTLKNPQKFYGLMDGSDIYLAFFNATMKQGKKTSYAQFRELIRRIPFFKKSENYPVSNTQEQIIFPKNINVTYGSRQAHTLGLDLFGGVLDELNFIKATQQQDPRQIYRSTLRRMKSRFEKYGEVPGRLYLVSSRKESTDFLEFHMEETLEEGRPGVEIINYAIWEAKADLGIYCGETFFVDPGGHNRLPKVLKDDEVLDSGVDYLEIPVELKPEFEGDIIEALQDFAGRPVFAREPLISDPAILLSPNIIMDSWEHPVKSGDGILYLPLKGEESFDDLIDRDILAEKDIMDGIWRPRLNPTIERYLHVDIGLGKNTDRRIADACGFGMVHIDPDGKPVTRIRPDGSRFTISEDIYNVDFLTRIESGVKGQPIDLARLRQLIYWLSSIGYRFKKISFDSFQSYDSIQELDKSGYRVGLISVDENDNAYVHLRSIYYEERVKHYFYHWYICELKALQRIKGKVDHPKTMEGPFGKVVKGSKDVSDTIAGATWNAAGLPDMRKRKSILHGDRDSGIPEMKPVVLDNIGKEVEKEEVIKRKEREVRELTFSEIEALKRIKHKWR